MLRTKLSCNWNSWHPKREEIKLKEKARNSKVGCIQRWVIDWQAREVEIVPMGWEALHLLLYRFQEIKCGRRYIRAASGRDLLQIKSWIQIHKIVEERQKHGWNWRDIMVLSRKSWNWQLEEERIWSFGDVLTRIERVALPWHCIDWWIMLQYWP